MKCCVYATSADPIHYGHINIIARALEVFDQIVVGIGINPQKKYTFTMEEREYLARTVLKSYGDRVIVKSFPGLLADFACENDIHTIIRGARNSSDFDFERLLNDINRGFSQGVDTIIYVADQALSHVSSSAAKELIKNQAQKVTDYVPMVVKKALERRINGQYIIGITGEIACGKSYVADALQMLHYQTRGTSDIDFYNFDLDLMGHAILEKATEPIYVETRKTLDSLLGGGLLTPEGMIDTPKLSQLIFSNTHARDEFDSCMRYPMSLMLRRKLLQYKGIILVDSALVAENDLLMDIVNNDVIFVSSSKETQKARLIDRGYSEETIQKRLAAQMTTAQKLERLNASRNHTDCGSLIEFQNDNPHDMTAIHKLYHRLRKEFVENGIS